ncbi:uncharacterized protein LOC136088747 [Hydra vulgaris]|uniref:Uncharacterized protein LOC136088747 n=1 Tax=Hydra vulgaris TaxID=6087 RepID=A0ABM4D501_HYDVU
MISGNAAGKVLSPFVVYKAVNLWSSWCEGGPKRIRYFNTKSGWFDGAAFEEWFFSIVLPSLKKKLGYKVLLGDNLSSHISPKVINACEKNEILFVCLPPNNTHITQPLDVTFFKPLKTAWRRIITEYKVSPVGCTKASLEKQHFPELLNNLFIAIKPNQANNLKSGFRKCGIYPVNVNQLLTQFRERESYDKEFLEDSFKIFLQEEYKPLQSSETEKRKKKLSIPAGKSVGTADLEKFSNSFDIGSKLAKKTKLNENTKSIKSKVQSEEAPKECHDHSSSSKSLSSIENKLVNRYNKNEKSSSENLKHVNFFFDKLQMPRKTVLM